MHISTACTMNERISRTAPGMGVGPHTDPDMISRPPQGAAGRFLRRKETVTAATAQTPTPSGSAVGQTNQAAGAEAAMQALAATPGDAIPYANQMSGGLR